MDTCGLDRVECFRIHLNEKKFASQKNALTSSDIQYSCLAAGSLSCQTTPPAPDKLRYRAIGVLGHGICLVTAFTAFIGTLPEIRHCATLTTMPTYIRFVVADIHADSGKELGIFHAVLRLCE